MSQVDDLVGELAAIIAALEGSEGEWVEPDALAERIDAVALDADDDGRRRLLAAVGHLEAAIVRAQDRVGERLRVIGIHRRALATYGTLRPHTAGQRVSSRA